MTDLKPVLTWVNQEREKRGMEPLERLPKGTRSTGYTCPIALALRADYSGNLGTTLPNGDDLEHPPIVLRFIHDFDNGKYPELVA